MKRNDYLIISYLREDCRMKLTKMSRKTNIPVSTLYERIKNYKNNIIKKHTAIIDFSKLGYLARARVLLKVDKKQREEIKSFLAKCNYVNELHKVNNGFDFMVECICTNMKELEERLDELSEKFRIEDKETYYIVDQIEEQNFLSKPNLLTLNVPAQSL